MRPQSDYRGHGFLHALHLVSTQLQHDQVAMIRYRHPPILPTSAAQNGGLFFFEELSAHH
jgi:hypothetical protein